MHTINFISIRIRNLTIKNRSVAVKYFLLDFLGHFFFNLSARDTNVYCRPFDDQSDRRIRKESDACVEIADAALRGKIVIVSSDYMKFEIEKIVDPLKRKDVRGFERTLASVNVASGKQIISLARKFSAECGLNLWMHYTFLPPA